MLEARIEKLRYLESKVKTDTVCSKENCPVALDPRTTSERFGNSVEEDLNCDPNKEMKERIERFRV